MNDAQVARMRQIAVELRAGGPLTEHEIAVISAARTEWEFPAVHPGERACYGTYL